MKRKVLAPILALAILCTTLLSTSSAQAVSPSQKYGLDTAEIQAVTWAMEFFQIPGPVTADILYDHENAPAYILGISSTGFLIMDRATQVPIEWGEGNPYSGHLSEKKYYGAILNYYVQSKDGFLNLITETYTDQIAYMPLDIDYEQVLDSYGGTSVGTLRYTPAGPAVLVPNSTSLIKRIAFGNNTDGSCGAVASTIALNYLDKTQNGDIVPANMEMEQLVGNSFVASTYPKADRFHKFLRDTCQMGTYVLPGDIVTGIANYSASSNAIARTGISLKWFNVDRYDIMNEILDGRPALICTMNSVPDFPNHVMVIYGYQTYSDSQVIGWLIHPGWYGGDYITGSPNQIKELWINPALGSAALCQFSCN